MKWTVLCIVWWTEHICWFSCWSDCLWKSNNYHLKIVRDKIQRLLPQQLSWNQFQTNNPSWWHHQAQFWLTLVWSSVLGRQIHTTDIPPNNSANNQWYGDTDRLSPDRLWFGHKFCCNWTFAASPDWVCSCSFCWLFVCLIAVLFILFHKNLTFGFVVLACLWGEGPRKSPNWLKQYMSSSARPFNASIQAIWSRQAFNNLGFSFLLLQPSTTQGWVSR